MGKALSAEDFGKIQVILRMVDIGIVLSTLGLKELVVKVIQESFQQGEKNKINKVIYTTSISAISVSIFLFSLFAVGFKYEVKEQELILIGVFYVGKSFIALNSSHILGMGMPIKSIFLAISY